MALTIEEIKKHILEAIPDASIEIKDLMGDNNHYSAVVKSKVFKGMNKIEQHKLVYKSLKGKMGKELHALALTTEENNMDIKENIKNLINQNDICLFMKGTPETPQCGFSMAVSNVLKHLNVKFKGINVLEDPNLQGIKDLVTGRLSLNYISKEILLEDVILLKKCLKRRT